VTATRECLRSHESLGGLVHQGQRPSRNAAGPVAGAANYLHRLTVHRVRKPQFGYLCSFCTRSTCIGAIPQGFRRRFVIGRSRPRSANPRFHAQNRQLSAPYNHRQRHLGSSSSTTTSDPRRSPKPPDSRVDPGFPGPRLRKRCVPPCPCHRGVVRVRGIAQVRAEVDLHAEQVVALAAARTHRRRLVF
jgi:hypothetical protein